MRRDSLDAYVERRSAEIRSAREANAPLVAGTNFDGVELEVHRDGIAYIEDPNGNPVALVHVRVSALAGIVLHWRMDLGAWARDKADRLGDLPDEFVAELEAVMERLRGPEDRLL